MISVKPTRHHIRLGETTYEPADRALHEISLPKRSGLDPIPKPEPWLPGDTPEVVYQAKEDQAEDEGDLEHGGDELDLAKYADEKDVCQK